MAKTEGKRPALCLQGTLNLPTNRLARGSAAPAGIAGPGGTSGGRGTAGGSPTAGREWARAPGPLCVHAGATGMALPGTGTAPSKLPAPGLPEAVRGDPQPPAERILHISMQRGRWCLQLPAEVFNKHWVI